MANINDTKFNALGAQGFTGSLDDRLLGWLKANGATSGNISDAWKEMLLAQGVPFSFHVNDGWHFLLGLLGYVGSLDDRELLFWADGGTLVPTPPVIPPANVALFALFANAGGYAAFRMDTTPWSKVEVITDSGTTGGLGCDFNVSTNRLALCGNNPDLQIWDTTTFPFVKTDEVLSIGGITQSELVRYNLDGTLIAVATSTSIPAYVFDTSDFSAALWQTAGFQATSMEWNRNGTRLGLTRTSSPYLYIYNEDGILQADPSPPMDQSSYSIAWHPLLDLFAVGRNDGNVWIYDSNTMLRVSILTGLPIPMRVLKWSNDGNRFYRGGENGLPSMWIYDCSADPSDATTWVQIGVSDKTFSVSGNKVAGWSGEDEYLAAKDGSNPYMIAFDMNSTPPLLRVAEFDTIGNSNVGDVAFIPNVILPVRPETIADLVAVAGIEQAALSWTAPPSVSPITSYSVQLRIVGAGTWSNFIGVDVGAVAQIIYALEGAQNYEFRIAAVSANGPADWSNVATATPTAISLNKVGAFDETGIAGTGAGLTWDNAGTTGANWNFDAVIGKTPANLTVGIRKGKSYLNSLGDAALEATASVTMLAQPLSHYYCVAPSGLIALDKQLLLRGDLGGSVADVSLRSDLVSVYAQSNLDLVTAVPSDGTEVFIHTIFNGASSEVRMVLNDGTTDVSGVGDAGANGFQNHLALWKSNFEADRDYKGDVFEMRVYDGVPTALEEAAILGAYQQKWFNGFPYIEV